MRKRLVLFAVMDPAAENERGTKLRDRQKYDDRKHHIDKYLSHLRSPEMNGNLFELRVANSQGAPRGRQPCVMTSIIACAKACGASWGRLCPMPPSMVRCEYLPENILA